jgi:hypothetical protein
MILTEKTKNKSYCCNKPIYIEKIGDIDGNYSERPYCSKCLKFPEASPEAWAKLKHKVDTGQILDSRFAKWKEENYFIQLAGGKWFSPNESADGTTDGGCPQYTDEELYTKYKQALTN